jgi:transcriptional regulator with XRE-family HTH domain
VAKPLTVVGRKEKVMPKQPSRADLLLAENVRTLISQRGIDGASLSKALGHTPSWLSKIINGKRIMTLEDAGRVASYFGITLAQLFMPRPREERRQGDRRQSLTDDKERHYHYRLPIRFVDHDGTGENP